MAAYNDTIVNEVVVQDAVFYIDLVESAAYGSAEAFQFSFLDSAAYGKAETFPFRVLESIVVEASAEAATFTFDLVETTAPAQASVTNTRADLHRFYEFSGGAESVVSTQTRHTSASLQFEAAAESQLQPLRSVRDTLQADAAGAASVLYQAEHLTNLLESVGQAESEVAWQTLHTNAGLHTSSAGATDLAFTAGRLQRDTLEAVGVGAVTTPYLTARLTNSLTEEVVVAATITRQVLNAEDLFQDSTVGATDSPLGGNQGQATVLEVEAAGVALIPWQTAHLVNTVTQEHSVARPEVQGELHATNTFEEVGAGAAVPTTLFSEWGYGASLVVVQRQHAREWVTQSAAGEFLEGSTQVRRGHLDLLTEIVNATGEVVTTQVQAYDLLAEAVEVLDEILEAIPRELWAINSKTLAFSRYTDTLATGVVSVEGKPLFTSGSGLQQFSEDQFADTEVEWGLSNFESLSLKRLVSAYVVYAGGAELTLSTRHSLGGQVQEHRYRLPAAHSLAPVTRRCLLARGFLGQYWGVSLKTQGGYAQLNNVVITPLLDTRRV